ncbi:MAG: ATP-binding protein, partial [Anaerolineae bacterium]|nr:ATP-binding protein [Anaerolineae bacterium]
MSVENQLKNLNKVFTPAAPVRQMAYLQGRKKLLARIDRALNRDGAHMVVYGESGVGKTSLVKIAAGKIEDYRVIYRSFNADMNFEAMMGAVLCDLGEDKQKKLRQTGELNATEAGLDLKVAHANKECEKETIETEETLFQQQLTPSEVAQRLIDHRVLIILDDFDCVKDEKTREDFAALIKNLSDAEAEATLMLVGVAENIEKLIDANGAAVRNLVGSIAVPRLTDDQIRAIATTGFGALRFQYEPPLIDQIVYYSANYPFFTHWLCEGLVNAYKAQVEQKRRTDWTLRVSDMEAAIEQTLDDIPDSVKQAYEGGPRQKKYVRLVQYTIARTGGRGIDVGDIVDLLHTLTGQEIDISKELSRMVKDGLLVRPRKGCYKFADPFNRSYTILRFRVDIPVEQVHKID